MTDDPMATRPADRPGARSASARPTPVRDWRNWLGLAFRLYLGGMLLVAGAIKMTNLGKFALDIGAYQLLPYSWWKPMAYTIAPLEVLVGLLLVVGCFTKVAAAIGAVLMAMFTFGISWVWAHGYSIDCGCFGTGGATAHPHYLSEILRDVLALLGGLWIIAHRTTVPSVDHWLAGPTRHIDDLDDDLDQADAAALEPRTADVRS